MTGLAEKIRKEMVRGLVSRAITCPRTGEVLDVRTCVVLVDKDGDPGHVMSQAGWRELTRDMRQVDTLTKVGLTPDPATVVDTSTKRCGYEYGGYAQCMLWPDHKGKHWDANGNRFDTRESDR